MSKLLAFNKPYGVLSQFTPEGRWRGLADWIPFPGIHAAGRLDADSEGLLLLTGDGRLQQRIADPKFKLPKVYWAQVEGIPDAAALAHLQRGVQLKDFLTAPCRVRCIEAPPLAPRQPPIRYRAAIPTRWLEIVLREGKNRQVRRMAAAVGHPVLRLVRHAIGAVSCEGLAPGEWRWIEGGYAALAAEGTDDAGEGAEGMAGGVRRGGDGRDDRRRRREGAGDAAQGGTVGRHVPPRGRSRGQRPGS